MRPITKLVFRMIILFNAVVGHRLYAEEQSQIIPEGIEQFRDYIKKAHANVAEQRATRALVLSRNFTKKPFNSQRFSPEVNELAVKLLDGWQAPLCLKKANATNPALIIVGESHSAPHCLLVGQANAREASQNKIVLAIEGVEFGSTVTTTELTRDPAIGTAIQTLPNTGVAHGIESISLGGLTILTALWSELSYTLLSHPDWSDRNFDYKDAINNIPTEYRRLSFRNYFEILFSQVFSSDNATAEALLAGPGKEASLVPTLTKLKLLRKSALASTPDNLNQHIEKSRSLFTIAEMSLFLRSISLNYYEQNRKTILEALSISDALLETQLDAYIKHTLSGTYSDDFNYLLTGTLRNLVFAKNISELYCNQAIPTNKSLVVQVGELHANALEYLFKQATETLPLQIRREGTASTLTTIVDDLKSLEQFIEQKSEPSE